MPATDPFTYSTTLVVPTDHPALPGHFPGEPLVPGVVILDRVVDLAEAWLGRPLPLAGIPQAKFTAPLRPGERTDVRLSLAASTLTFTVSRGDVVISRGAMILRGPDAP